MKIKTPLSESTNQWVNELKRQFPKEEMQITNEYLKKYSIFLAIKEKQINTALTQRRRQNKNWSVGRKAVKCCL